MAAGHAPVCQKLPERERVGQNTANDTFEALCRHPGDQSIDQKMVFQQFHKASPQTYRLGRWFSQVPAAFSFFMIKHRHEKCQL